MNFSLKIPKYVLNVLESCKGSLKVSVDIFWAIGDFVEAQKSDFSQKIVQKLVNPSGPSLLSSRRDIKVLLRGVWESASRFLYDV